MDAIPSLLEPFRACTKCSEAKPVFAFCRYTAAKGEKKMTGACLVCRNVERRKSYYKLPLEERAPSHRKSRLRNVFGITPERYAAILEEQGGVCAMCRKPEAYRGNKIGDGAVALSVDHDHRCCPGKGSCGKCVRGLLCGRCNMGIGQLGDDPALLRAGADYVESFR